MIRSTLGASLFTLSWLIYSLLLVPQDGARGASLLETSSFETHMNIIYERPGQKLDISLSEKYSHDQERLLLNVRGSRSTDWWQEGHKKSIFEGGTVFHDAKTGVSLLYKNFDCKRIEFDELMRWLDLNILPDSEFKVNIPTHIVGPSKWIYYIANQRRLLKLDLSPDIRLVKNVRSVRYLMSLTDSRGKQVAVRVYYPEASLKQDNHEDSLPNLIVFDYGNEWKTFVHITLVRFTSQSSFDNLFSHSATMASLYEPELDAFTLPPARGCSALLGETNRKTLFELRHKSSVSAGKLRPSMDGRFSFRAQVRHDKIASGGLAFSAYVAYDHVLKTMRVDSYTMPTATQIFQFYRNRLFHILDTATVRDDYLTKVDSNDDTGGQRKDGAPPQMDSKATEPRCTSSRIHLISGWPHYSFGYLLCGADTFVYLGQARVRGIRASVYEAFGSQLPYWLEQPVDYRDTDNIYKTRAPSGFLEDRNSHEHLVTLIYVSDEDDAADSIGQDKMLLMEIYRMDQEYKTVYDKRTVTFHDFSWNIVPLNPIKSPQFAGAFQMDPPSDQSSPSAWALFSLPESCAAEVSIEGNEHAQVEMLLESVDSVDVEKQPSVKLLTENTIIRNVAILAALQRPLASFSSMIYDLQTHVRLVVGEKVAGRGKAAPNQQKENHDVGQDATRLQFIVAFNMARYSKVTTDLYYVGRGSRILSKSWFIRAATFAQCFALASHRPTNVYFAYNLENNWCYICKRPSKGDRDVFDGAAAGAAFELNPDGYMEIYWTHKIIEDDGYVGDLSGNDVHSRERIELLGEVLTLNTGVTSADKSDSTSQGMSASSSIKMSIRRLNAHYDKQQLVKSTDANVKIDSGVDFVDKIDGFGLIERETLVEVAQLPARRLPAEQVSRADEGKSTEPTTFDQCQSICLTDFDCRSFSFCIRGAQVECLTSKVSLSSPALVAKLMSAAKPKSGRYELEVEDDAGNTVTVQLGKRLNCAIHNKRYTSYFYPRYSLMKSNSYDKQVLRATGGLEECARICFRRNIKLMSAQHERAASVHDDANVFESVSRLSRDLLDDVCSHFDYVDHSQVPAEMLDKWNQLASLNDELSESSRSEVSTTGGYCVVVLFSRKIRQMQPVQLDPIEGVVGYFFSTAGMFEKEYGTHLRGSELSEEEMRAYKRVVRHHWRSTDADSKGNLDELDQKSLELVRAMLKRGDNFQIDTRDDRDSCAQFCFRQTIGLWPACRSFDVILEKSYGETRLRCVFNTISKQEALASGRLDLIDSTTSSSQMERWHYEPRVSLGLNNSFELAEGTLQLNQLESAYLDRASHVTWLISVALVSGLLLGVILGENIKKNSAKPRRQSQDSLAATMGQAFPMSVNP